MHGGTLNDRRALEREALRHVINQWNANRLDLFELSEPNEDLEFHGVMRFYFQDSGQKVATKCIRVASDATVEDVIGTLVEKFRPDMRMLSVPCYALYELHEGCPERKMSPDEKPLLVQLKWHVDDREGRFLLKNVDDDKTVNTMGPLDTHASFRRKLSKREKKQLKKQEKMSKTNKIENGDVHDQDGVAEKLYTELPETSFTRSISNPEAVMRRRRQIELEKKLQQFRSKDGGPDTGGTLKIYGEALCKDVPYKTLLLSVRDCAGTVVRQMLEKYGFTKTDPSQWCLVQVTQQPGCPDTEYILDDDECPLNILMSSPNTGSIMFHVRRRPADCAPRKRKKKPGAIGQTASTRDVREVAAPLLVELGPDGSAPHPGDTARTIRLTSDMMEVGSANGIGLQLYGPHIQPRHCVITINAADGATSLTPCHADAHTYVNGQRIHQTTVLQHGSLVKFGHSNTYRFLDPAHEDRTRPAFGSSGGLDNVGGRMYDSRSPRALSPTEQSQSQSRENIETTFDLDGNVETVSTASGARDDNRSLGSSSENRLSGIDRYPRGQDPILPAVLEFPEEPQEQFLARVITHLDVTTPTFRLAPAYTLYLCARYRASTHYRPELTPTERAQKLTVLLQHAAKLIRLTVQDRSTESTSEAFWLANASELLHFLKSDRHVSAFSLQAQDTLADAVQLAFKNLVACLTDELNAALAYLMSVTGDDHPREIISVLSGAMNLLRKCRVNAALTIQLFSQLFHWISAKALTNVISNSNLCTKSFGQKLFNRLRNLQAWTESQGLELAAECHLAKIVQCAHLLQAPKYAPEDLANLSAACFKLNSMQLGALLKQYKAEPGEKIASPSLLEQAAKAAESVADELARAEGREVTLYEDPAPTLQLLLPDDGFSCDVVQGVPPGLADFLHPLQASGLCRLASQPTSSGHWTVYMSAPRPPSAMSATQPEVQVIRLHKAGGGMGLSIVAAKGAGQEQLGIYIKSVVPGGAADRDGRLAAGDQLLSVDRQSLLGITQEKAAEFLQRTGSTVTLEVAKAGAVYHGLATLLQQPSPTPHRALENYSYYYDTYDSTESLYSPQNHNKIFTPPATKPKNNIFFNSDDSLFKSEKRRFTIPRIEIESDEPVFNLQVTDFSEPCPKNVTLTYDETGSELKQEKIEEYCAKPEQPKTAKDDFAQRKSFSIEINESTYDIDDIGDTDKFLSIGARRFRQQRPVSGSLQDLSSSTSSINSGVHESNLDLSQIDDRDAPLKHKTWRSPYEIRHRNAADLSKRFDDKAISVPTLNQRKYVTNRSKSVSEERLNDKLTEYERIEVLKLLYDWSLNGSDSKSEFNVNLIGDTTRRSVSKKERIKFNSEPDLSPKSKESSLVAKFYSDHSLSKEPNFDQFYHNCEYRNCIFNIGTKDEAFKSQPKPKGILKQSKDPPDQLDCLNNITNLQRKPKYDRRHSEIIDTKPFNSQLVRCDSLERLNDLQKRGHHKKFPDSYIVTRRNSARKPVQKGNNENKIVAGRKKCLPKAWKSCSDIKSKKPVRKCCRYAKKTCPVSRNCGESPRAARKTRSCASFEPDDIDSATAARLDALKAVGAAVSRPRRMSERDLPSRVDSERSIPSSKSVPALHQIHSPGAVEPQSSRANATVGDIYSRTSSSTSINTHLNNGLNNGQMMTNGGGPVGVNQALRSRSTHNLHQQDGGFYQNLSIYNRNKNPSPQQLGDRTSALRSSQNSLHSSIANSQRPASAYYPPPASMNTRPANLHQSIPNLKSPPNLYRLPSEDSNRVGSYPNVQYGQNYYPSYQKNNFPSPDEVQKIPYGNSYAAQNQSYPSPTHSSVQGYPNHVQQPLHVNAGVRQEERGYNNGGGLLREDVFRQSQNSRHEEIMRYPSQGNIRISDSVQSNDLSRYNEMRSSKSEDLLKQHAMQQHQSDITRYASSGNIRDGKAADPPQLRQNPEHLAQHRLSNEDRHLRGAAKLAEMSEEVRRRQNRAQHFGQPANQNAYYQQQQLQQQYYNQMMAQNAQGMQNMNIGQQPPYGGYPQQTPLSPTFNKMPPVAPKPSRKDEYPPELPPTSTHPLYLASSQEPPKMAYYPSGGPMLAKPPRDPWAREEQERQQEARREAARQWQEQQIMELSSLPYRTPQQDEQLRVLQLEREFQRRAMEAAEEGDEDTEKESSTPQGSPQGSPNQPQLNNTSLNPNKLEHSHSHSHSQLPPTSILKPSAVTNNALAQQQIQQQIHQQIQQQQQQQQNLPSPSETAAVAAPPPPERGSSFAVMSMRTKESTKKVSFNDSSAAATPVQPPTTLQLDETVREDPNSFIRQAESMLASPVTPTDASPGTSTATPGVIGAQEVYRDPRARRLAEQAQRKDQNLIAAVPEKLSFKEKMKMFAMETGEKETPKDKSKISRAQRDIDSLGSPNLVH